MLSDPIFKIALSVSFLAHAALVAPHVFFSAKPEVRYEEKVNLNYIIIKHPQLSDDTEVFARGDASGEAKKQKAKTKGIEHRAESMDQEHTTEDQKEEAQYRAQDEKQVAYLKYHNLIREKIRGEISSYSKESSEGVVEAVFTLDSTGHLLKINSIISGNMPTIKQNVARSIKRAQPFPSFPEEMGRLPISFSLTIKFIAE